jgi:hypothetical protein
VPAIRVGQIVSFYLFDVAETLGRAVYRFAVEQTSMSRVTKP